MFNLKLTIMKISNFFGSLYCVLFVVTIFFIGCSDEPSSLMNDESLSESTKTAKAAFNNSFDWENSFETKMKDEKGNISMKRLPWQSGINNPGVPIDWYDPNIESKDYSIRKYTKEKGWELVYSNLNEATAYKYIGLYNKYTGIMRFFMSIFAEPGSLGSSGSMWGISVNKPTTLLNFTYNYAKGNDNISPSPAYVSTPVGSFSNNQYNGVGIQNGAWYGFEFACTYDSSIPIDNNYYFTLMGRAITQTISVGDMETTGTIGGTIKGTIPTSSTNLSFSDMFNKTSTDKSINLVNSSALDVIGDKIDKGTSNNDGFLKGLWNNVKKNASKWITSGLESGAKKGLEAIISKGGSVVGDAIGGLFNSLIGGNNKDVDLKVDLSLKTNSTINITSTTISQGWSDVSLPVPGNTNIGSNLPIYNKPLGVWNLKKTPEIIITPWQHDLLNYPPGHKYSRVYDYYHYLHYSANISIDDLVLNPTIRDLFNIKNFKIVMLEPEDENKNIFDIRDKGVPYAILNSVNYYAPTYNTSHESGWKHSAFNKGTYTTEINFKVLISFDLVLKSNNSIIYTHSRVFDAKNKIATLISRPVWNKNILGGGVNTDIYNKLPIEWNPS